MTMTSLNHAINRRTLGVLGVTAVSGVLVAACTGSPSATSVSATTPASGAVVTTTVPAPSTSGGATPGGSSSQAGSSAPSSSTPACVESQLRATIDDDPPIGTLHRDDRAVVVYFQNTSSSACTISGYPGAAIADSSGKQVEQAIRTLRGETLGLPTGQNTLPVVTLQPGKYASAGIEGVPTQETGAAQAGCDAPAYPRILVTPPNTSVAVPFDASWPVCETFTVHPTNIENNPPS